MMWFRCTGAGPHVTSFTEAGPMQESTPSRRQRGASSAAWGSMPKSTMLDSTCGRRTVGLQVYDGI